MGHRWGHRRGHRRGHRWSLVLVLAGCWTAGAPHPPAPEAPRGMPFPVDPRLLGDDGFVARLDHHAWLVRYGRAWIRLDEELEESKETFDVREPVAVLDVAPGRVRVFHEEDDARLAVWIERRNLAPTIVNRVQLAGDAVHGVWLDPGTEIRDPTTAISGRREFDVLDDELRIHASVAPDVLGDVWVGPVPREPETATTPAAVASGATIRVAPDAGAPALAEATSDTGATIVKAAGAWTDVEIKRNGVRVRGFVPSSAVSTEGFGRISGLQGTGGYGISDTESILLPAGACLYARPSGPVVGVNTTERERYIRGGSSAWPAVVVQTPWGLTTVTAHVVGRDGDERRLATCTR